MSQYNDLYYGWPAPGSDGREKIPEQPEKGEVKTEGQEGASPSGVTEVANALSHVAPIIGQVSGSSVSQLVAHLPLIVLTPPPRADGPSVSIPIVLIRQSVGMRR